jgi:hypothetical protein
MMPFAFADGNEGDNSSDSEDEAKPAILSIEKISNKNLSCGDKEQS